MKTINSILVLATMIFMVNGAQASFLDVLNVVSSTASTINSVNSAARGTMSTIEYSQRFTDRQQDRKEYKTTQKEYNSLAQDEYYKVLQENNALKYQMYNTNGGL